MDNEYKARVLIECGFTQDELNSAILFLECYQYDNETGEWIEV